MTKRWRNDITICPLNKRVHFLINYNNKMYECVGTLMINMYNGMITRGQCLDGSSDIFFNGDIVAWGEYITDTEAEAL